MNFGKFNVYVFSGNNRTKKPVHHIKIFIDIYIHSLIIFKIKMVNVDSIEKYIHKCISHIL